MQPMSVSTFNENGGFSLIRRADFKTRQRERHSRTLSRLGCTENQMSNRHERQHCAPAFFGGLDGDEAPRRLERVPFEPDEGGASAFGEGWLQRLAHRHPTLLPLSEIEPSFGSIVSVCIELPTAAGPVDNLFLTSEGNIVLGECKLWRNPQARREVVAQIMDYARAMSSWEYSDLEQQARRADSSIASLYELVADVTDLDEAAFVDAVARNLLLGRVLLLILGDGIRLRAEELVLSLQQHAGFHFTLALVEMPVYRLPSGGFIAAPRILARTLNIERGVVSYSGGIPRIEAAVETQLEAASQSRSISSEQVLEQIRAADPGAAGKLEEFVRKAADRGAYLDAAPKSLVLRWRAPSEWDFALATFQRDARVGTTNVNWVPDAMGRVDLAHAYLQELADIIDGQVHRTKNEARWYVKGRDGSLPRLRDLLQHEDQWLAAIDRFIDQIGKVVAE